MAAGTVELTPQYCRWECGIVNKYTSLTAHLSQTRGVGPQLPPLVFFLAFFKPPYPGPQEPFKENQALESIPGYFGCPPLFPPGPVHKDDGQRTGFVYCGRVPQIRFISPACFPPRVIYTSASFTEAVPSSAS